MEMLYKEALEEAIFTVAPGGILSNGELLTNDQIVEHALQIGGFTKSGLPIRRVAYVFFDPSDSNNHLPTIMDYGLVCRVINAEGVEETLFDPHKSIMSSEECTPPLIPVLKDKKWLDTHMVVHNQLLEEGQIPAPVITYGYYTSDQIAVIIEDEHGRSAEQLHIEAMSNLKEMEYEIGELAEGLISIEGVFGAEQVLLCPEIQDEIKSLLGNPEALCISTPSAGPALVCDMIDLPNVKASILWSTQTYADSEGQRISEYPLMVVDGAIHGIVKGDKATDATSSDSKADKWDELAGPSKPWWKFW